MGISLGKGLAIAAGIGAVGIGGYMLLKGGGDEKEAGEVDPKDPLAAGGDPAATGPPTGTTMAPAVDPNAGTGATSMMPSAGTQAPVTGTSAGTGQGKIQGEQVGPYTVATHPSSGVNLVYDTETQVLQGVLDQQGNLLPAREDANGNIQLLQEQGSASALGQQTSGPSSHPGTTGVGAGSSGYGTGSSSMGSATASASDADRGAVYQQIAAELFANASDPTIGSASSDAMYGQSTLSPAVGNQAGSVMASGQSNYGSSRSAVSNSGNSPQGTSATGTSGAGGTTSRQVGEFTLVEDGSGVTLILDTASQEPVGMMDQAGNVTPIRVDENGELQVTGQGGSIASNGSGGTGSTGMTSNAAVPSGSTAMTGTRAPVGAGY